VSPAQAAPAARRLSRRSRLSFGIGSIAYGVKDNGFATFLLLFYNQVIGLPAASVGLAIMAALVVEAFVDPLVGYLSDHTRGRWGRRHPWMYASALPVAIGWLLLWNPPAWSHDAMLVYVFGSALLVRIALSMFEIPGAALGPELSADYDERTRLFSYRYLFGWGGGLAMLALAYAVFLVPDATHPVGTLNADGYARMAAVSALVMATSILVSAIGLHPEIPNLPEVPRTDETLAEHLRDFGRTVWNRGFLWLMAAGVFAYTAQGISFALSLYMYQFVWVFGRGDYNFLSLALMAGALGAFFLAPRLTRGGDKPRVAMAMAMTAGILLTLPYLLRFAGLFPAPGSPMLLPVLLTIFALNTACGVSSFILGAAMLSDVVEDSEIRTGKRSEGVFFAGGFFVQKLVGGLGIFVAGRILAFAQFPVGAKPGQVPLPTIDRLTAVFVLLELLFYGVAALCYARFPFGRAEHEARLRRMA
jgi:GPH family glycoside/pentoside/hexuronide:cation symporter